MLKKKIITKITGIKEIIECSGRGEKYGIKNDDQKANSFKNLYQS